MIVSALAFIASMALALYVDWLAGQWMEGGLRATSPEGASMRLFFRVGLAARYVGLFSALAFLVGALANRVSGNKKGPD
jgi:hypothetical protein